MIEYTKELNVASQCRATASDELSAKILVDGGSGTLRELLNDAASSIENLANDELLIKSLYESLCECFAPTWESGTTQDLVQDRRIAVLNRVRERLKCE